MYACGYMYVFVNIYTAYVYLSVYIHDLRFIPMYTSAGQLCREGMVYEYASGIFLRVPMNTVDSCYIAAARKIIGIGNMVRCPSIYNICKFDISVFLNLKHFVNF